ncbi:hypothetical protein DCCM_0229 [Desulfocucumis palustris]|uniref:Uncharacterized protein n=1 Tax=Desulfocucumis palustris TaxID=1898651 RepID=A0A2L2X7I2_9FIRM|nr:hypothetical protein [Desulfocucumis palustris]GBF32038.1 hypothetical protein DCCM_0229 [Desulfocucumis palustris]
MGVSLQINIHTIRIADVDTGSAVAIGYNYFYDWQTCSKTNNGFGRLSGDGNGFKESAFRVDDNDVQDMLCGELPDDSLISKALE